MFVYNSRVNAIQPNPFIIIFHQFIDIRAGESRHVIFYLILGREKEKPKIAKEKLVYGHWCNCCHNQWRQSSGLKSPSDITELTSP